MTTADKAPAAAGVLQMIRAELNVRDFQRWMGSRRLQDPDHAMHCLLTECFGDLAPKPFRLILPRGCPQGTLYGYGPAAADDLREAAAICADPLQAKILPVNRLDSKPMPATWMADRRLGFEVRVRPIVRRTGKAQERPGKECDAFLHEALQHPERGGMQRTREQVYTDWLAGQLARRGGASLEPGTTKLVAFQRTRAVRKLHARHSEGPDAVLQGNLTITDPQDFHNLLAQGVGRHRAYGYGMLLLRPARG